MYLLDSNVCIRLLNESASSNMARKLAELTPDDIRLCSVVKSELYYGAYKSTRRDRNLANLNRFFSQFISLPFDDNAAAIAGQVRAQLDVAGTPIGSNDLLIAAIALSNDLTLVTHNTREFGRINGLKYEDWE
ncbi:type II toxin-antitoxin system tRNA(fMet)-specific endonuclease VapC [Coleofasciculus sp. F4-SAH-05]|jgi:tRNA(fMet)-specific endonuclease VapC|uniref:type II toxin-antitoxin system tRNA(fMet)-specific endonuclease VapC n=1 Tax=Coleofasciculus TaxID=669368 RepID=UPI0032FD95D5